MQAGYDILLFCACGAVGQLFIFATIKTFGSLLNTLVTTTRKFFNILLSGGWPAAVAAAAAAAAAGSSGLLPLLCRCCCCGWAGCYRCSWCCRCCRVGGLLLPLLLLLLMLSAGGRAWGGATRYRSVSWAACRDSGCRHTEGRHPPPSVPAPAVVWNANPLLPQQWAAVALVFSGLLVSSWTKSRRHARPAAKKQA